CFAVHAAARSSRFPYTTLFRSLFRNGRELGKQSFNTCRGWKGYIQFHILSFALHFHNRANTPFFMHCFVAGIPSCIFCTCRYLFSCCLFIRCLFFHGVCRGTNHAFFRFFNSISSPSPFTFTTVPTPHFLCTALSPAFHAAFSAPVVIFLAAAFLIGACFFTGVVGEPNMPSFVCSNPSSNSSGISSIKRLIG